MRKLFVFFLVYFAVAKDLKWLQGPPDQFNAFVLPSPLQTAESSTGELLSITFGNEATWFSQFLVDSQSQFSFCLASPNSDKFDVMIQIPASSVYQELVTVLQTLNGIEYNELLGLSEDDRFPVTCYQFQNPPIGQWNVEIKLTDSIVITTQPAGYFILYNQSPVKLRSWSSQDFVLAQSVDLLGEVFVDSLDDEHNMTLTLTDAEAVVAEPNGLYRMVELYDDGLHNDYAANDGIYGGSFTPTSVGRFKTTTYFTGIDPWGTPFTRSVQKFFNVINSTLELGFQASAEYNSSSDHFDIHIPLSGSSHSDSTEVIAYAEIWGSDVNGNLKPVLWVSGVSDTKDKKIVLHAHINWFQVEVIPPFILRNVRIQDINYHIVLSQRAEIPLKLHTRLSDIRYVADANYEVMTNGPRPAKYRPENIPKNIQAEAPIIISHGYCSDGHPFSLEDFTNYYEFVDSNANRLIQEFSEKILAFSESLGLTGFSLVAHSQGGLASLHLATFYWSGLDMVDLSSGRLIQSVGSPYMGTHLAGSLADIGGIFGTGCGANDDLTKDGASKWLSGIPPEKQKLVYFVTTQGDGACSWGADFIGLDKPNDGVTSKDFAQLPYGNYVGHKTGYCHVDDMTSPAQCRDHDNNQFMNKNAARKYKL